MSRQAKSLINSVLKLKSQLGMVIALARPCWAPTNTVRKIVWVCSLYQFPRLTYFNQDLNKEMIAKKENVMCLATLVELMSKVAKVDWGAATLKLNERITEFKENALAGHRS